MSTAATTFRMFFPQACNLESATTFHNAAGQVVAAPIAWTTGPSENGLASHDMTFAEAVEPLFVTPVWTDPLNTGSIYLCRNDAEVLTKVIDETAFNSADPGRPTPKNDKSQFLLYTETVVSPGVKTYAVEAPTAAVAIVKDAGKDDITGENLPGNNILIRWSGPVPTAIEVEADVEDITDPAGYFPVPATNITTDSESSLGLSLIKVDSQVVPRDGMGHAVNFRIRYNIGGDTGPWVEIPNAFITFQLEAPNPPTALAVTLLRDRIDNIPDVVKIEPD